MTATIGPDTPKLGFGLMRLPRKGESIDVEQVKEMVDLFMGNGFTYFDTAYAYEGSEEAIREALVKRYPRDAFTLTTKLAPWLEARNADDAREMFYTSLNRTGAGYFDLYLMHNLGVDRIKVFDRYDLWNFVEQRREEGLIKHLGFSFHDKAEVLDEVLEEHPEMEYVQLQINYADWDDPVVESRKCYEVARNHGKQVIIMEPVKGGALAELPVPVSDILRQANPSASSASWAIRFAASLDGVVTVLSGMSDVDQMKDNISFMKDFLPLSAGERETIADAQKMLSDTPHIPCTDCRYCMKECPNEIAISGIFSAYNEYLLYGDLGSAKNSYMWATMGNGKGKASDCVECGQCESVCTQSIPIIENLKKAESVLE